MGKEGSARDNSQKFLGEGREPCGKGFSSIGISLQYRNGRRARLRIWFRKDWRFKSSRAHHICEINFALGAGGCVSNLLCAALLSASTDWTVAARAFNKCHRGRGAARGKAGVSG